MQEAVAWTNVDQVLSDHMVPLGHSELKLVLVKDLNVFFSHRCIIRSSAAMVLTE